MRLCLIVLAALLLPASLNSQEDTESSVIKVSFQTSPEEDIRQKLLLLQRYVSQGDFKGVRSLLGISRADTKGSQRPMYAHLAFTITEAKIEANNDTALVYCTITDFHNLKDETITLRFNRTNGRWNLEKHARLIAILNAMLDPNEPKGGMNPPGFMWPSSIQNTNRSLLSIKHPGTTVYQINDDLTVQVLNQHLFRSNAVLGLDAVFMSTQVTNDDVALVGDEVWGRIIFGQQVPGNRWLRSYGDNPGDHDFGMISGMITDPFDSIFIADKVRGNITKLFFNRNLRTIDSVVTFEIPFLNYPTDIAFDQGIFEWIPNDGDGLWIADEYLGKIVKVSRAGVVQKTITHYNHNGSVYRLQRPKRIVSSPVGGPLHIDHYAFLGVIDAERNAFVALDDEDVTNGVATAYSSTEFDPAVSELSCLGIDRFGQLWVGDRRMHAFHTFDMDGNYLATIVQDKDGTSLFPAPAGVTRFVHRFTNGGQNTFSALNMVTADLWGSSSGLRYFYPGADAVNLSALRSGSDFVFQYTLTNSESLKVDIVDESGATLHSLWNSSLFPISAASINSVSRPASIFSYGHLRLRVTVRPYYNSLYPDYAQQPWLVREVPFTNALPAPANVTATGYPGNIKLTWNPISGICFNVFRNGDFIASVCAASYWDHDIVPGQTYTYTLQAYSGSYTGPMSSQVTAQATHLQSLSSTALTSNSQRKMAGINGVGYFVGYESDGEVFVTLSTNLGTTWSMETRSSLGFGWGSAPSIAAWTGTGSYPYGLYCSYREGQSVYMRPLRSFNNGPLTCLSPTEVSFGINSPINPDGRPVVAPGLFESGVVTKLTVAWDANIGIILRDLLPNTNGTWRNDWSRSIEGPYHRPSMSVNSFTDLESNSNLYLTFDDGDDIFLACVDYGQEHVPASMVPQSFSAQIAGEQWGSNPPVPKFHIVWEAIRPEEGIGYSTDGGGTWGGTGATESPRKVMYERYDGDWFYGATEFVNGTSGSFYRPTVTYLSNDNVVMAWDDGVNSYKAVLENDRWSITEVYCNVIAPQLMTHGTNGLLTSTRVVGRTPGSGPYQLQFPIGLCNGDIQEEAGREIDATIVTEEPGDTHLKDSMSYFSIRIRSAKLKRANGSIVPLDFIHVPDTTSLHDDNAWQQLTTRPIGVSSSLDSLVVDGSVNISRSTRFTGTGERMMRLSFNLLDGQSGQLIRRVGNERRFDRDTTHMLRVRDRLTSLAGRSVVVRPSLNWIGRGDRRIKYTLVNIHTLYVDSTASRFAKMTSTPEQPLPKVFALHQNYPNPFNPSTEFAFDLPASGNVELVVFDVLGRRVAELANGNRAAGFHSATWNASNQASGVYFAKFTITNADGKIAYSKINKLVLMK